MNKQRASTIAKGQPVLSTDIDDWETDPDYIRDMDEMDQRWGAKRTIGSVDMNDLIEQVNREDKIMRDKYQHPSQRSSNYARQEVASNVSREPFHGYEEKMSKQTSTQEISRKVYTTTTTGGDSGRGLSQGNERLSSSGADKRLIEKASITKPTISTKPDYMSYARPSSTSPTKSSTYRTSANTEPKRFETSERFVKTESPISPLKETTTTKRIFREEKNSASSSRDNIDSMPQAFRSIQDKIDAFKKEFEDIESRVSRKSDISKVITKSSSSTMNEKRPNFRDTNYVPRSSDYSSSSNVTSPKSTYDEFRSASSASNQERQQDSSRAHIKGLSKRFETLCRESEEDFRRRTDARRQEFFDQIKNQVRETRKGLDGFDPIDEVEASDYGKPKVYTRSETTKEEIVSKMVKENDKIVANETKRNVERSSSCHGSSDDETNEPTSIKYINQHLVRSPTGDARAESPVEEIRRKVPVINPEVKGAGLMARTLYDYTAAEDDELSFDVDDLITNIEKVDKDWYRGTITKGGRRYFGLFPAIYAKLLNDTGEY